MGYKTDPEIPTTSGGQTIPLVDLIDCDTSSILQEYQSDCGWASADPPSIFTGTNGISCDMKCVISYESVTLEEPISSGYPAQPGLIGESVRYGCVCVALILWLVQQLHKRNSNVTSITVLLLCDIREVDTYPPRCSSSHAQQVNVLLISSEMYYYPLYSSWTFPEYPFLFRKPTEATCWAMLRFKRDGLGSLWNP